SRRLHTRFSRDWSSDVCSSDLEPAAFLLFVGSRPPIARRLIERGDGPYGESGAVPQEPGYVGQVIGEGLEIFRAQVIGPVGHARSEERRVGKEGGSGRSRDR